MVIDDSISGEGTINGFSKHSVLIVDDDESYRILLTAALSQLECKIDHAADIPEMREKAKHTHYSVILLDVRLGLDSGIDNIPWLKENVPDSRILVMTASDSPNVAVQAMHGGADGFVVKSSTNKRALQEVSTLLHMASHNEVLRVNSIEAIVKNLGLAGDQKTLGRLIDQMVRIQPTVNTVLISGESGTGKALVAKAIHKISDRTSSIFRTIKCRSIPVNLLERELLGFTKKAFYGAKSDHVGLFELCSTGTLLLDEVGEIPFTMQETLFRILVKKQILPLGATEPREINTRVIATTEKNLFEEVKKGNFHPDLYNMLATQEINCHPLRESLTTIPHLVKFFINEFCQYSNKRVDYPTPEVLVRLMSYKWPENIRELRNAVERAVTLSTDGSFHIEDMFLSPVALQLSQWEASDQHPDLSMSLPEARRSMEKQYLNALLTTTEGNVSKASTISGIHRANIYRMLDRHGLSLSEFKTETRVL